MILSSPQCAEWENNNNNNNNDDDDDNQDDQVYFEPFHSTEYDTLLVPNSVPNDIALGSIIAVFLDPPYNKWCIGKVKQVHHDIKFHDNINCEIINNNEPTTIAFIASQHNYGIDKAWILLEKKEMEDVVELS